MADAMARLSESTPRPLTKARSILRASRGKRRRYDSDE